MPILPGLKPSKIRPRVDMRVDNLRRLVFEKGMRIKWSMAAECPCQESLTLSGKTGNTRESRVDCAGCSGTGIVYHSEQEVVGIVSDPNTDYDRFRTYGEYETGSLRISLLPEHAPGPMDRLELLDNVMVFRETKKRTASTTESLRYPIVKRTFKVGSAGDNTVSVTTTIGVLYMRKATTAGVISSDVLEEGTDFIVNSSGEIDWTLGIAAGTAPSTGEFYSASFYVHPTYVVTGFPYTFRDTNIQRKLTAPSFENMPTAVNCKLEFLVKT
jgi:hypothetical protein